jgi:hypothetical protein
MRLLVPMSTTLRGVARLYSICCSYYMGVGGSLSTPNIFSPLYFLPYHRRKRCGKGRGSRRGEPPLSSGKGVRFLRKNSCPLPGHCLRGCDAFLWSYDARGTGNLFRVKTAPKWKRADVSTGIVRCFIGPVRRCSRPASKRSIPLRDVHSRCHGS